MIAIYSLLTVKDSRKTGNHVPLSHEAVSSQVILVGAVMGTSSILLMVMCPLKASVLNMAVSPVHGRGKCELEVTVCSRNVYERPRPRSPHRMKDAYEASGKLPRQERTAGGRKHPKLLLDKKCRDPAPIYQSTSPGLLPPTTPKCYGQLRHPCHCLSRMLCHVLHSACLFQPLSTVAKPGRASRCGCIPPSRRALEKAGAACPTASCVSHSGVSSLKADGCPFSHPSPPTGKGNSNLS